MKFVQNKKKPKYLQFNFFPKNRKGDLSVLLLVVLVLLVASVTLFSLVISSGKVKAKISNAQFINNFYSKQDLIEFYLNQAEEKAIVETYNEFVENSDYINNPITSGKEIEFKNINNRLDENFRNRFIENFENEFGNYNFEEDYLNNLKQIILNENFEVVVNKDILIITIDNLEMNSFVENINLTYIPEISLKFNLKKIGLNSFYEIYDVKEKCKNVKDMEDCYGDLINFNVSVIEKEKTNGEKYFLVTLVSKKRFLIDGKFDNLQFSFVPM